jgi:hypothetical protein
VRSTSVRTARSSTITARDIVSVLHDDCSPVAQNKIVPRPTFRSMNNGVPLSSRPMTVGTVRAASSSGVRS